VNSQTQTCLWLRWGNSVCTVSLLLLLWTFSKRDLLEEQQLLSGHKTPRIWEEGGRHTCYGLVGKALVLGVHSFPYLPDLSVQLGGGVYTLDCLLLCLSLLKVSVLYKFYFFYPHESDEIETALTMQAYGKNSSVEVQTYLFRAKMDEKPL